MPAGLPGGHRQARGTAPTPSRSRPEPSQGSSGQRGSIQATGRLTAGPRHLTGRPTPFPGQRRPGRRWPAGGRPGDPHSSHAFHSHLFHLLDKLRRIASGIRGCTPSSVPVRHRGQAPHREWCGPGPALSLAAGIGIPATAGAATGTGGAGRLLHPQAGLRRADQGVQRHLGRQVGVTFSQSFGASGSQATAVVNGLPADVVNFSLAPDMTQAGEGGHRLAEVERHPYPGHGHQLDRLLRGPQGEPQAHHQLGQPGASPASRSSRPTRSARAAPSGT